MLHDQAMLLMAFTEAWLCTRRPELMQTAQRICEYIHNRLAGPEGAFYTAEDADTKGVEGAFYLWTSAEIKNRLPSELAQFAIKAFGLDTGSEILSEDTAQPSGKAVLRQARTVAELSGLFGLDHAETIRRLESIRNRLFTIREKRPQPARDDKILCDWNGLMIAALAKAGRTFGQAGYISQATRAADFVLANMYSSAEKILFHRNRNASTGIPAMIDDYAFLVWGLIELYWANFDPRLLKTAVHLCEKQIALFWDSKDGGFFSSAEIEDAPFGRRKDLFDGALPSGNSVSFLNLIRLARLTGRADFEQKAQSLLKAFSGLVNHTPSSYTQLLYGLDLWFGPSADMVLCGPQDHEITRDFLFKLNSQPNTRYTILFRDESITQLAPFTKEMEPLGGKPTIYLCWESTCMPPTNDLHAVLKRMGAA